MTEPLISVENLKKYYYEKNSFIHTALNIDPVTIQAVDGVDFDIHRGETLSLVGESGCGKSSTGETLLRLREPTDGSVMFDGTDIYQVDEKELLDFRRRAQIVFQDPSSSLDPRMTINEIIQEPMIIQNKGSKEDRQNRAEELIQEVGLSGSYLDRYPHEFSGGQQQRIVIARALALEPDFIVLDEPVSALDVSVQAQILNLLNNLQEKFGLTYLCIAHDLSVVRNISDRVAVMYLGEIVEIGPVKKVFEDPEHPYTQALLETVPRPSVSEQERDVEGLPGSVPSPRNPPDGCRFHTRCKYAREVCEERSPKLRQHETGQAAARCFRPDENHEYWDSDSINQNLL